MRVCQRGHEMPGDKGACPVCRKASAAAWRKANPDYARKWREAQKRKDGRAGVLLRDML
jgi:hypothetical protein